MGRPFSLSVTARPPTARVALAGEIDVAGAPELVDAVLRLGDQFDRIDFDLAGVTFMDASGVRAFEQACDEADRRGFSYRIVALSRAAARVFDLTGQSALLNCN
jgi:anti-anti-sigma factor